MAAVRATAAATAAGSAVVTVGVMAAGSAAVMQEGSAEATAMGSAVGPVEVREAETAAGSAAGSADSVAGWAEARGETTAVGSAAVRAEVTAAATAAVSEATAAAMAAGSEAAQKARTRVGSSSLSLVERAYLTAVDSASRPGRSLRAQSRGADGGEGLLRPRVSPRRGAGRASGTSSGLPRSRLESAPPPVARRRRDATRERSVPSRASSVSWRVRAGRSKRTNSEARWSSARVEHVAQPRARSPTYRRTTPSPLQPLRLATFKNPQFTASITI